jgi:hypothetical protein
MILEQQLENYLLFLDENLGNHDVDSGNIEPFKDLIKKFKEVDYSVIFKLVMKTILIPNWTTIFDADNHLDSGKKTIVQQATILKDIIDSLKLEGKVNNKYLPDSVVEIINRDFLTDFYKVQVLSAELTSEYNLCNPEISWKDAHAERIRIAFYSALVCGNIDVIMPVFNKIEQIVKYGQFKYVNKFIDSSYLKKLRLQKSELGIHLPDTSLPHAFLNSELKSVSEEVLQKIGTFDIFPLFRPDIIQMIEGVANLSIAAAIADDYLDLGEDLENNKITGMTQGIKHDIKPGEVFSTTLLYIRVKLYDTNLTDYVKDHADQFLKVVFHDMPGFVQFCKEEVPFIFEHIFQRI